MHEGSPCTLVSALRHTAREHPDKGIHFIQRDRSACFRSYAELLKQASRTAGGLKRLGFPPGSHAILQLDTLEAHYTAFWGCLLASIVPVTVAIAPTYNARNGVVDKLCNTWRLLNRPPVITSQRMREALTGLSSVAALEPLNVVCREDLLQSGPSTPLDGGSEPRPADVAFIQLSSGSTGVPKCIQETHQGVIAHIHSSKTFNGYSSEDITLNWLPPDHVVPLLTFHLKDTYLGCEQVHVPTDLVLAEPLFWLDLLEQFRVTHTWSPNFGFKLVSDRLARASSRRRDLSAVRFFMNAGEQVTMPAVRGFLTAVAPFGVPESAMQPAFGMAEVCTCMTYANRFSLKTGARRFLKSSLDGELQPAGDDEAGTIEFVSLGRVSPGVSIRIADAANGLLPENFIGRLQIKGPVVTPGYLRNEADNQQAFVGDGWFNSGDLGFISNGELFLTGREKETIIIRGAKFYCHEIEDIVNGTLGVEPTFAAACGISDASAGTEKLAVFFASQEITDEINLAQAIRKRVTARLGIAPEFVIPVVRTEFPRTTSGKVQRMQLKKRLEQGGFREIQSRLEPVVCPLETERPLSRIEQAVADIWRDVLGAPTPRGAHLFDVGGDSLKATQIISRVRERCQVEFPLPLLFDGVGTVAEMARWIAQNQGARECHAPPAMQPESRNRELPLSYSQLRVWLADQIDPGTSLYNICRALTLHGPLNAMALEQALNGIIQRHEILRTVYRMTDTPVQEIVPGMPLALPRHDLTHLPADERQRVASNLAAFEARRPFNLADGPFLRAKLIRMETNQHLLVLTFHQLVTDAWSLGVFFRELAEFYSAAAGARKADLPSLPVQYADYAVWQQRWLSGAALEHHLDSWKEKLAAPLRPTRLRRDGAREISNTGEVLSLTLRKALLDQIRAFNAATNATLHITLLTAYKLLLFHRTGEEDVLIGSPESGRRWLETEGLLGCFVNMLPLRTRISADATFQELVTRVRATTVHAAAHADLPYERLLEAIPGDCSGGRNRLFHLWFGAIDSLQAFSLGEAHAVPAAILPASAQFDLSCFVAEQPGSVTCLFEYKPGLMTGDQIRRLLHDYEWLLFRVIETPRVPVGKILEDLNHRDPDDSDPAS